MLDIYIFVRWTKFSGIRQLLHHMGWKCITCTWFIIPTLPAILHMLGQRDRNQWSKDIVCVGIRHFVGPMVHAMRAKSTKWKAIEIKWIIKANTSKTKTKWGKNEEDFSFSQKKLATLTYDSGHKYKILDHKTILPVLGNTRTKSSIVFMSSAKHNLHQIFFSLMYQESLDTGYYRCFDCTY